MNKAYFVLGVVSLVVGIVLLVMSLGSGVKWLGLIMGGLLALNGAVRLWLVWHAHSRTDIASEKRVP